MPTVVTQNQHPDPILGFSIQEMVGKSGNISTPQSAGDRVKMFRTASRTVNDFKKCFKEAVGHQVTRFALIVAQHIVHIALDQMLKNQGRFHHRPSALRN